MRQLHHGRLLIYCDFVGCTNKEYMDDITTKDDWRNIENPRWRKHGDIDYCLTHYLELDEKGELDVKTIWDESWKIIAGGSVVMYSKDRSITLIKPSSAIYKKQLIVIYEDIEGKIDMNIYSISEIANKYDIPLEKIIKLVDPNAILNPKNDIII